MTDAERLAKLRRTRGGHRGSAKRLVGELEAEIATADSEVDLVRLSQLKRILEEKIETLKRLDEQVLDFIEEESEISEDIEEADGYKAMVYAAIIKAEKFSTGAPVKRAVSVINPVHTESPSMTVATVTTEAVATPDISLASVVPFSVSETPTVVTAPVTVPTSPSTDSHSFGSVTHTTTTAVASSGVLTSSLASNTVTSTVSAIPLVSSVASSASTPTISASATKASVKLPKLTLSPFSGDLTQWFTFWDSFQAAVHDSALAGVDKFNYLKSLLSGVALESIQGLTLSDANYVEAVSILHKRFGNWQQIIE